MSLFASIAALRNAGFRGFETIHSIRGACDQFVPATAGVYCALWTADTPKFTDFGSGAALNGRDPEVAITVLWEKWVPDTVVVYIGKAGGPGQSSTLCSRVRQFLDFGEGKRVSHWGGRYVWQLVESDSIRICWLETSPNHPYAPRLIEKELLQRFKADYFGRLSFANLRT